ncbi:MAG: TIGR00730 family Rossman fold protein [Patescibacteria group bacterium]
MEKEQKQRLEKLTKLRVDKIASQFKEGFEFIAEYPRSVTFFGSSLLPQDDPTCISARTLAGRIAKELGYAVLTGGGPGIMEAANRGAKENGGASLALTIKLPHPQITNDYLTKQVDPDYFFVRKVCLSFLAEALIFYPGGFGTLDEFYELMTLSQTKKIVGVPVICVGSGYWKNVETFMKEELVKKGLIMPEDVDLMKITDNLDEVVEIIKNAPVRVVEEFHV